MLFTNKIEFKTNREVYFMLTQLEKAHTNKDELSASILLTRLKALNITFKEDEIKEKKVLTQNTNNDTMFVADDIPF